MEATAAVVERPASSPSAPVKEPASAAPGPGASDPPTGKSTNETTAMSTATATAGPANAHALAGQLVTNSTQASEPTTTTAPTATAPTATSAANAPTVNAVAASSAAMMMTSSTMTPTPTNYALNAQLAKATSTLTPMGGDKVSTAGPVAAQKGKQTKKKADGETAAKKPSPRARAKADPSKAEKRKASPARSNAKNEVSATATPANGAGVGGAPSTTAAMPTTSQPGGATPTPTSSALGQGHPSMGENLPTDQQQQELLPSQDTELRRMYLQRIYRQLQMTHRNQDDTMVRRLATNIEIDICRRASTRPEYVALMNQHINSLMQAELTNGTVGLQSSLYVPGVAIQTTSNAMNVPASSSATMVSNGLSQPSVSAYKQASTPAHGGSEMAQRAPTPTQGSFMSLLSGQAPMQSFDASRSQHQYGLQSVPAAQTRQPPYTAPNYQAHAQGLGQAQDVKTDLHGELAQQQYATQRQPTQPSPTSAPPDFVAQFQRLDRNGLLDLLWTQHRTVVQYQRRLAQLEVQLNLRHTSSAGIAGNNVVSTSTGVPSAYYTASAGQPPIPSVPPAVSAEAEAQRARERANSRAAHQSSQYGQAQYPPSQAPSTPQGVVNPQLYWEKVRYLKESYLRYLYVAHQALSQHSAPANSAQGLKAENVKHNIALASTILNEAPTAVQPRPLEVLDSIERFIQSTVVPIVRKVSPQNPAQTTPGQPSHMLPQQNASDLNDPMRGAGGAPPGYQPSPTPSSSFGVGLSNGTPPPAPATTASPVAAANSTTKAATAKGAKSTGKKSPSGSSKKTTPKASGPAAPKAASKAAGRKSPGRAGGAKQNAKTVVNGASPAADQTAVQVAAEVVHAAPVAESSLRDRSQMATMKSSAIPDDDLNDFSDFADLDFDDDLQDPLMKVPGNKENATGGNSRKRSIEDV